MIMTGFALYGWYNLKIDFSFEYFVTDEDAHIFKYNLARDKYFPIDDPYVLFYTNSTDIDFYLPKGFFTRKLHKTFYFV